MTKICLVSGNEKRSNEGTHVIHYDKGFRLKLENSTFETPDERGRSFNVKFLTFRDEQKGKRIVVLKWLLKEHCCPSKYHFKWTKKSSIKASRVVAAFTATHDTVGWKFTVVKTTITKYQNDVVSVEPYINNLHSFEDYINSETCIPPVVNLLKALCFFSYRFSKGKFVLENLKIGVDQNKKQVFMLPPSLVSRKKETYGCEDNGKLYDFFNPACNKL